MDSSESSEFAHGKELRAITPGALFEFAKNKQLELRAKLGQPLAREIGILADTLDEYMTHHFDTPPEVIGESRDIYETIEIHEKESSTTVEHTMRKILNYGEISSFEQHSIKGKLFGFHRGLHNELRAYVDDGRAAQKLAGGVYQPLLSLGLEHSDLQFVETSVEQNTDFIDSHLDEMDERVVETSHAILEALANSQLTVTEKLRNMSPLFTELAINKQVNAQFIDALLEIVKYKLRLDLPYTITTSMHRVIISQPPTFAHLPVHSETTFEHVSAELGIAGETKRPWLGIFFIENADSQDEANIQIPVDYITSIYRTETL